MGRRGPAPKSKKELKARGSWRAKKRAAAPDPPPTPPAAPDRPDCLDEEGKAEWARIVPELQELGLVAHVDRAALTNYCLAWSRLCKAQKEIEVHGLTFNTEKGDPHKRPEVAIAEKAQALIHAFLQQFGLSPASRARVTPTKKQEQATDGKARFFKKP